MLACIYHAFLYFYDASHLLFLRLKLKIKHESHAKNAEPGTPTRGEYTCHHLDDYPTDDEANIQDMIHTYDVSTAHNVSHNLSKLEVSLLKLSHECLLSKRASNAIIKWYNTMISMPFGLPIIRGMDALRREMDKVANHIETKSIELHIDEGISSWTGHTIHYRDPILVRE